LAALIQRTHAAGGEVQYISAPGYDPQKLTIRDHWMIDRAHAIIAGWDGAQRGGTWNAITYACNVQRPIFGINHTTRTAEWMVRATCRPPATPNAAMQANVQAHQEW
jgi:hypothetical protein